MPADTRFLGNSIEEMLVAIAEGVREAQAALDEAPLADAAGRSRATYHLPYLDFTIRVEMTTQTDSGGRAFALLLAAPPASTTSAVQSTLTGRLVAVPPGDGLPIPRLSIATGANIGDAATITVSATNSAGETLANQLVELNIDPVASASLSGAHGGSSVLQLGTTRLEAAVLTTGADGTAATRLLIDSKQGARNAVVVVVATLGAASARGAIPMESVG